jgi:hypothetical protein
MNENKRANFELKLDFYLIYYFIITFEKIK